MNRKTLTTIYFISFRKKGFENRLHYINTPKQLILEFYDSKNDNFHLKIVIVLLFFFCFFFWLKNKLWVHPQSIFEQKSVKECIPGPLSESQSFFIKHCRETHSV